MKCREAFEISFPVPPKLYYREWLNTYEFLSDYGVTEADRLASNIYHYRWAAFNSGWSMRENEN